ncbi:hypothetical protein C8R45DRAFT_1030566 [Mycena sanguinolenta]|nr:hypothetical protein C8R45DRAFT_1030566 [Mycena sanguinolenta]
MSWQGAPPQYNPVAYPAIPGNKPAQHPVEQNPPRLRIVGATWGGILVTSDVQAMVSPDQTLTVDVDTLVHVFSPDPLSNTVKILSVLYHYENSHEGLCLLSISEEGPSVTIRHPAHQAAQSMGWQTRWGPAMYPLGAPWRADPNGVEIIAVLWGGKRIETPPVLAELAKFFEGRRGQIRMTNSFFKCDPWLNHKKTWTVYFRFAGSQKVQVVTGIEDGALEVPWGRY